MKRDDVEFCKNCQLYNTEIRRLMRAGKVREAHDIVRKAEAYLRQWEDYLKSVRLRIGVLRSVLVKSAMEERKAESRSANTEKL